jgi:hypothetical protein
VECLDNNDASSLEESSLLPMVVLRYLALTVPILVLAIGYGAGYMRMLIQCPLAGSKGLGLHFVYDATAN